MQVNTSTARAVEAVLVKGGIVLLDDNEPGARLRLPNAA
jgi:hypothetical protein